MSFNVIFGFLLIQNACQETVLFLYVNMLYFEFSHIESIISHVPPLTFYPPTINVMNAFMNLRWSALDSCCG